MITDQTYNILLAKILSFLAYKMRSKKEVADKIKFLLEKFGLFVTEKLQLENKLVAELENQGLLDDRKYIATYIQQQLNGKKAVNKRIINAFLYKKGLEKHLIDELLQEYLIDNTREISSAQYLLDKKLKNLQELDVRLAKRKLITYLLSKGYDYNVVYPLVDTKFKLH